MIMEKNTAQKQTKLTEYGKGSAGIIFLLLVISGFCFYTYYEYTLHQNEIAR